MFKFAIKVGLAGTAIYYLREEGVWKDSNESLKIYDKINTTLDPYIKEVKNQIPFNLPQIRNTERTSYVIQQYWNQGVQTSCQFLSELPNKITTFTSETVTKIIENPDIKKLLENKSNGGK